MASWAYIGQQFTLYVGLYFLITGLAGSIMQIIIYMTVATYRKTPCTFYFLIATIFDCDQLIASLGPYVVAAFFNIDLTRISVSWCKLRFFFATSFSAIPLSCACLATIDQFLVTSQNAGFRQWSNMTIARRASLCVIITWWIHGSLWLYFQDMSPITGVCVYIDTKFLIYAIIFIFFVLCFVHMIIMSTFSILAYQNVRKTTALARQNIDRQMVIMVSLQVLLTLIGLGPYGIYVAYTFVTIHISKSNDRKAQEALVATITYILCFLAYGVCHFPMISFIQCTSVFARIFRDDSMCSSCLHLDFVKWSRIDFSGGEWSRWLSPIQPDLGGYWSLEWETRPLWLDSLEVHLASFHWNFLTTMFGVDDTLLSLSRSGIQLYMISAQWITKVLYK